MAPSCESNHLLSSTALYSPSASRNNVMSTTTTSLPLRRTVAVAVNTSNHGEMDRVLDSTPSNGDFRGGNVSFTVSFPPESRDNGIRDLNDTTGFVTGFDNRLSSSFENRSPAFFEALSTLSSGNGDSSNKSDGGMTATNHSTCSSDGTMQTISSTNKALPAEATATAGTRRRGRPRKALHRPWSVASATTTIRVKYDMELVPVVQMSPFFWNAIQAWPPRVSAPLPACNDLQNEGVTAVSGARETLSAPSSTGNKASSTVSIKYEFESTSDVASTAIDARGAVSVEVGATSFSNKANLAIQFTGNTSTTTSTAVHSNASNVAAAATTTPSIYTDIVKSEQPLTTRSSTVSSKTTKPTFFANSILFIPNKRKDWEESVSELVALCTSAAYRRYQADITKNSNSNHTNNTNSNLPIKPFYPPLSRQYIQDRVDIDDPLNGYQIRHSKGGWLQGFLMWTNFTTWNTDFVWDSLHPQSGLATTAAGYAMDDARGSLAKELQALPRHGNVMDQGVVFDHVAEIALLGALGCGELLLRMAIEDIRRSDKDYRFVVLQATEGSRPFYEKFGFIRVGAICRYGIAPTDVMQENTPPYQGYRHWTHANESQQSLDLHGGPSYMMCLKLPSKNSGIPLSNLLETMAQYQVQEKTIVLSLGALPSPIKRKTPKPLVSSTMASTSGFPTLIDNKGLVKGSSVFTTSKRCSGRTKRTASFAATIDAYIPRKKRQKMSEDIAVPTTSWLRTRNTTESTSAAAAKATKSQLAKKSSISMAKNKRNFKNIHSSSDVDTTKITSEPASSNLATVHFQARDYLYNSLLTTGAKIPTIAIEKNKICKQKVKAYPRDREHFYNRVVQHKKRSVDHIHYFVLDYEESNHQMILIPMKSTGVLSGKRSGRPRQQCIVLDDTSNWKLGSAHDYVGVPSVMVMKTPYIAQEAWDILD